MGIQFIFVLSPIQGADQGAGAGAGAWGPPPLKLGDP